MSQEELVSAIAKEFTLTKTESRKIIKFIQDRITESLKKKGRFYLRDFGSFTRVKRAAKKVRHPKTKKIITIPKRIAVEFNPSKSLLKQ